MAVAEPAATASAPALQPIFAESKPLSVCVPSATPKGESAELVAEDSGAGSSGMTCVCLPGLGDLRQSYRFLGPKLQAQGHRVLALDLRGHGDSSAAFSSFAPLDLSSDIGALLQAAGVQGNVVLFANSLAGSSALHFAATHPDMVAAVVGLAPVARDLPQDASFRFISHLLFQHPWGVPLWMSFYNTLFQRRPEDLEAYKKVMASKLKAPGHMAALGKTARGSKTPCFQEAGNVKCPVLLIHGSKDPDFSDPRKEGEEVKAALTAAKMVELEVMEGLGHYPHVEEPEKCFAIVHRFMSGL